MAASLGSDSPPATARSSSPPPHHIPSDEAIQNVIERATANARAANGGRSPVIGRDTRTQLFVGNLPYRVRWQDLKDLFRKAGGTVLRADVCLGPDNRSRGYGTVLLASAEDAGRAIDMFNGYVWQTRTLEVRPDRLPNDFDSSAGVVPGTMNKLALGLSPQPTHYASTSHTMAATAASAIHPLSMSPAPSAALPPLQAPSIGHSTLGMTTGLPSVFSQDSSSTSNHTTTTNFTTADALRTSIAGDMTRSPSAIKLPPTSSTPSNTFDSIAATTAAVSSNGIIPSSLSHPPTLPFGSSDPARRTVYVANWPSQYGKSDLDHFFRSAGTVVKSDLTASNGSDNTSYGTVVYSTEEEAKNAVAQLNGFEINGRSLSVHIGKTEQLPLSLAERRKSDEIASTTSTTMMNGATTNANVVPNGHHHHHPEASYSYASYVPMSHPAMPAGYILASQPGSPYEQYPPPVGYMQVSTSPTTAYPPPLNGGMYAYSAWQHAPHKPPSPPSAVPQNGSAPGTVSGHNSASSGGSAGHGNTGPSSSSANAGTSSNSRVPPGPISLPSPSISGYPPAPISPMHLPPITPSMPSFTFVNHPMPTPPLHHPHHHHPQFMSAAGMGTYSPLGSPGYYRTVNPYFNLSPGAPVPYHHDANAIASNGVIGSGVAGMLQGGQVATPYFDRTAATAGSDAPNEYFPPMPITTSLTGAIHAMHISSSNTANASANANGSGNNSENESKNEDQPFLEPVGVGRDGFPSLSAKPTEHKATDGVSRTGLTDWVTTPDDLPGSGSKEQSPGSSNDHSTPSKKSVLSSPAGIPAERASSVGPMGGKAVSPTSSNSATIIATTASSPSPGSGRSKPFTSSSSSGKKPKLNLGSIPGFSPPARMMSGYAAAAPPSTSSPSMMGPNGTVVANRAAQDQYRNGSRPIVPGGHHHHGSGGQASRGHGTPNGREALVVVDHEAAGHRRNSWAEDNTRRQSISHELQVGSVEGGYVR